MNEHDVERIFAAYGAAIPEVEPSPQFMPNLWQAIESQRAFRSRFGRLSRAFVTAACAIVLVMATLLVLDSARLSASGSDFDIVADSHAADLLNLETLSGPDRK